MVYVDAAHDGNRSKTSISYQQYASLGSIPRNRRYNEISLQKLARCNNLYLALLWRCYERI